MSDGFLGNDASFMLDFVVCALVLVVPVVAYSIFAVKVQKKYLLHRNLQIFLAVVLAVAVAAFEVDIRLHGGWENIVNKDAQNPRISGEALAEVRRLLFIHLVFAISTPFLWGGTFWLAWKRFPSPPFPSDHSRLHKKLGWLSTADLVLTSVTGLWFYYAAFIAR
ncbi:MAG: DUF420 domain-containing protein [Planctomycetota bacterium]|nr:MAG: DUF420 domain-containing protein [Planctomycetota bacterium]REK25531.1 MAG: DUF420 domain-containing protein [Planctomycetota bacterium]